MASFLRMRRQRVEPNTFMQLAIACERLVQGAAELPHQGGRYISPDDWKAFTESFTKIKETSIS